MVSWFLSGGFIMWPILGAALVAAGMAVDAGRRLSHEAAGAGDRTESGEAGRRARRRGIEARIAGVLFWGVFAALVGLLGTLVGVRQVARWVADSGGSPAAGLVWSGLRITLPPTVLGLAVLMLCMAGWALLLRAHERAAPAGRTR